MGVFFLIFQWFGANGLGKGSCRCRKAEIFSLEVIPQPYDEDAIECADYGLATVYIFIGAIALAIGKIHFFATEVLVVKS